LDSAAPARTEVVMGTVVTIHVSRGGAAVDTAINHAFAWFFHIEEICTRFNPKSELMQLTRRIGEAVKVSDILYETVQFALTVAEESGGAFDPTVGHLMESRGFNREHNTGEIIHTPIAPDAGVSWRDVHLDPKRKTITLGRSLGLDLGAVAKGLAVDAAARELQPFHDFTIDAGGDLYLGGHNPAGEPWSAGIRHPRLSGQLIDTVHGSDLAVCTSGDYERREHILNPASGVSADAVASATVVASGAMLADALATAAFVLGPVSGIAFLELMGVEGFIVTPQLATHETSAFNQLRVPHAG
jgi:thiamine biosynthesis lipoprotein